jgi:hypothetical protein
MSGMKFLQDMLFMLRERSSGYNRNRILFIQDIVFFNNYFIDLDAPIFFLVFCFLFFFSKFFSIISAVIFFLEQSIKCIAESGTLVSFIKSSGFVVSSLRIRPQLIKADSIYSDSQDSWFRVIFIFLYVLSL